MADWREFRVRLHRVLYHHLLRWFDARRLAAWPGERRAQRFVWLMLVLHRLSYLLPATISALEVPVTTAASALNIALLAIAVGWSAVLCGLVQRHRWFTRRMVNIEVGVACLLLFAVTPTVPGHELGSDNWSTRYMLATGAVLGAALKLRWAMAYVVPVAVSYAAALTLAGLQPSALLLGLNSFVWFTIIAHVMRWYLCAQGQALDNLSRQQALQEAKRAAEQARHAERLAHHRALHDSVLATLTAIARGGLDHRVEQVRQRCEHDASYLRRLIDAEPFDAEDASLGPRLMVVAAEAERQGIRVHHLTDALPALPPDVVDALAGAVREALNNVAAHSGSREAWLTALSEDGSLIVRVVDRGDGFDPAAVKPGFGLHWSVVERMREAGGEARVTSAPGEGTCVELTWSESSSLASKVSSADGATIRPRAPG